MVVKNNISLPQNQISEDSRRMNHDDTLLEELRSRAEEAGMGYQTIISEALKEYLSKSSEKPITESMLRYVK